MTTLPLHVADAPVLVAPEIDDLFSAVIADDPEMAPEVADGSTGLAEWFTRKTPAWTGTSYDGNRLLGHVSVRKHTRGPGGLHLPPGRDWELMHLVVHPDARRKGIASTLVADVERRFRFGLWSTVREGSPSHQLFASRGWAVIAETTWHGQPGGIVVAYTGVFQ